MVTENSELLAIDQLSLRKQGGNGEIDSSAGVEIQDKVLKRKLGRTGE